MLRVGDRRGGPPDLSALRAFDRRVDRCVGGERTLGKD